MMLRKISQQAAEPKVSVEVIPPIRKSLVPALIERLRPIVDKYEVKIFSITCHESPKSTEDDNEDDNVVERPCNGATTRTSIGTRNNNNTSYNNNNSNESMTNSDSKSTTNNQGTNGTSTIKCNDFPTGFARSFFFASSLKREFGHQIDIMFHLTCHDLNEDNMRHRLEMLKNSEIYNLLVISGEQTQNMPYTGRNCALDAVRFINKHYRGAFKRLAVSGYPSGHPNSHYMRDLDTLKAKIDSGANLIITQCIYTLGEFEKFKYDCEARGIQAPIWPSLALFESVKDLKNLTIRTKVTVPPHVHEMVESQCPGGELNHSLVACSYIYKIIASVHSHVHICSMNKTHLLVDILKQREV